MWLLDQWAERHILPPKVIRYHLEVENRRLDDDHIKVSCGRSYRLLKMQDVFLRNGATQKLARQIDEQTRRLNGVKVNLNPLANALPCSS